MFRLLRIRIATLQANALSQYLLLGVATLLAAGLRFYRLGDWSFWGDEAFTLFGGSDGFRQSFSTLLIRFAVNLLGTSEWSARLVPALLGILSVPILYLPVRKIYGPRVALLAALLLAISPWHLYWSQNARFYILLLLFYSLALFAFYLGLEEDRPAYLVLCLVLLGLGAIERLIALFLVPVMMTYLLLLLVLPVGKPPGLRPRNLVILFAPGAVGVLIMAAPYLRSLNLWLSSGFGRVNNHPFWLLAGVVYYVRLPVVCLGAVGAIYLLTKKDRAALLLALSAVIPLLGMMAISLFHYAANRYIFVSLVCWLVLAAVAAVELFTHTSQSARLLAASALLFLIADPLSENLLYYRYQNGNRDQWREAFVLIGQEKAPDDRVVVPEPLLANYYLHQEAISMYSVDLSQIEKSGSRVWFVESLEVLEGNPGLSDWIRQRTQLVANLDVHVQARNFVMRVYLFSPQQAPANYHSEEASHVPAPKAEKGQTESTSISFP